MKRAICVSLLVLSTGAAARQTADERFTDFVHADAARASIHDQGFVADAGTFRGRPIEATIPPAGPVDWIRPDELGHFNVNGRQFTAKMQPQIYQTIVFDQRGTAYLYWERLGEQSVVRISKEGAGAEGNFMVDGWPFVINRGQVFSLDDSRLRELIGHLGRLDREHVKVIAKGAALGVATLIGALLGSFVGLPHAVPAGVLAAFASGGYYGWLRRDRFKMTQMELGFAGNRFGKKIRGLERVIGYEPQTDGDVVVTMAVPGGGTKTQSVRALMRAGKIRYAHADCEVYLSKIRTMNAKQFVRNMAQKLVP